MENLTYLLALLIVLIAIIVFGEEDYTQAQDTTGELVVEECFYADGEIPSIENCLINEEGNANAQGSQDSQG